MHIYCTCSNGPWQTSLLRSAVEAAFLEIICLERLDNLKIAFQNYVHWHYISFYAYSIDKIIVFSGCLREPIGYPSPFGGKWP